MRNVWLDCAKVIFAIMIIFTHTPRLGDNNPFYANYGFLAVEFFFMCTGYFVAENLLKHKDAPLPASTFLLNKVKIIWPAFIAAEIMAVFTTWVAYSVTVGGYDPAQLLIDWISSITEILMLSMTGIPTFGLVGVGWYFSTMIIGLTIIYPLAAKFPEFRNGMSLGLGVILLGTVYLGAGTLTDPLAPVLGLRCGLLRGLGSMCIGLFANHCVHCIIDRGVTAQGIKVINIISLVLFVISIGFILLYDRTLNGESDFHIVIILFIWIATALLLIESGEKPAPREQSERMKKVTGSFGELSLLLILCHCWILTPVSMVFHDYSPAEQLFISIVGIILASIVCHYFAKLIRRLARFTYDRMFVVENSS